MQICGLQKLSLLDFPENLAATIFTGGCNLRCPFCHNASLVLRSDRCPMITEDEVFAFLSARVGKLDGVCITGGEPLLQTDLENFIKKIRDMGFLIKLDTNGTFPRRLASLTEKGLLDYVAIDIKSSPNNYGKAVGIADFDCAPVLESVELLKNSGIPYEFRTTLVRELHTAEDIREIGKLLSGTKLFFLQNYENSGDIIGTRADGADPDFHGFDRHELESFKAILQQYIATVQIRN